MELRKLEIRDAALMLEWMHDDTVVHNLKTDFFSKTLDDCCAFILDSQNSLNNVHLAIVDENDEYMGTVSLKDIHDGFAEFAITIRNSAMGKGYSKYSMSEIIKIGIVVLNLNTIYWCVSPENARAVRFYDKNGYKRIVPNLLPISDAYSEREILNLIWYAVTKNDIEN